jgi:hypothetical protein
MFSLIKSVQETHWLIFPIPIILNEPAILGSYISARNLGDMSLFFGQEFPNRLVMNFGFAVKMLVTKLSNAGVCVEVC